MLAKQRHREICRILDAEGSISLTDLRERLEASLPTIRRDVSFLASNGRVARSHGAVHAADEFSREPHFRAKTLRHAGAKIRIAHKAVELLPHDGNVFVDAGTTCMEVGRLLTERSGLRIYTNSIPLLALACQSSATLISIGGEARGTTMALTGTLSLVWLENLKFDAAVIGASGVTAKEGAFTTELQEASIKTEVLRRTSQRMLVVHARKWGHHTALRFAPWTAFSNVVSDYEIPSEERRTLGSIKYIYSS